MNEPSQGDIELARFLAERDAPCPGCGYNLRGLESAMCPECGARLRMGVVLESGGRGGGARPWVRTASHPALILGAAMVVAAASVGRQGAAVVLVGWIVVLASLGLRRRAVRYLRAPLAAQGDWVWRWFVIVAAGLGWLFVSMMAIGVVASWSA